MRGKGARKRGGKEWCEGKGVRGRVKGVRRSEGSVHIVWIENRKCVWSRVMYSSCWEQPTPPQPRRDACIDLSYHGMELLNMTQLQR